MGSRADPPPGISTEHFMEQRKAECYFVNGTEHVRYVLRCIHNREEILRFDSDVGVFVAITELGRPEAEYWNTQKEILKYRRDQVNTYCRHNYQWTEAFSKSWSRECARPGGREGPGEPSRDPGRERREGERGGARGGRVQSR